MAKTESHTQLMVFQHLRNEHGITLTDNQLETIDEVYLMNRKNAIFMVGIYRFINAIISLFFLTVYWFLKGTKYDDGIFICSMLMFLTYNCIHCFNDVITYKNASSNKLKKPLNVGSNK